MLSRVLVYMIAAGIESGRKLFTHDATTQSVGCTTQYLHHQ
jgi:hypothetical protein